MNIVAGALVICSNTSKFLNYFVTILYRIARRLIFFKDVYIIQEILTETVRNDFLYCCTNFDKIDFYFMNSRFQF